MNNIIISQHIEYIKKTRLYLKNKEYNVNKWGKDYDFIKMNKVKKWFLMQILSKMLRNFFINFSINLSINLYNWLIKALN